MKKYQMIRKLKLTDFEIRVAIDALAAYRRKQIENNIEHDSTNELLLRFCICWKNNYIGKNISRLYDHF